MLSFLYSFAASLFALKAFRVEGARASVCTKRASSLSAYRGGGGSSLIANEKACHEEEAYLHERREGDWS
jgi:hypothetical protein